MPASSPKFGKRAAATTPKGKISQLKLQAVKENLVHNAQNKLDLSAAAAYAPAKAPRETAEEKMKKVVQKAITDNFKGAQWTNAILYAKVVQGKTLSQHIEARIREKGSRGKGFYDELKWKFAETEDSGAFTVDNGSEAIPDDLEDAVSALVLDPRATEGLKEYFEYGPEIPNQKCAAIVGKVMFTVPTFAPVRNAELWQEFIKFIVRTQFHVKYPDVWAKLRPVVDTIFAQSYQEFQTENWGPAAWWKSHRARASLVLEAAHMDKLTSLGKNLKWCTVEDSVLSVYRGSDTGRVIYEEAYRNLGREKMETMADEVVAQVMRANITQATTRRSRESFLEKLKIAGFKALEVMEPWATDVTYRQTKMTITVNSYMDMFTAKRQAAVLGAAVDAGVLAPLLCEDGLLVADKTTVFKHKVDADVVEDAISGRSVASSLVEGRGVQTGSAIVALFRSKWKMLYGEDKDWRITFRIFEMHVGSLGEEAFRRNALGALPTAERAVTCAQALTALRKLEKGKLFEFIGAGLQKVFRDVIGWVQDIKDDKPPAVTGESSPFVRDVKESLAWFYPAQKSPGGGAPAAVLRGKEAAEAAFAQCEGLATADELKDDPQQLTPLLVFSFCLSPASRTKVQAWKDDLVEKGKRKAGESSKVAAKVHEKATQDEVNKAKLAAFFSSGA